MSRFGHCTEDGSFAPRHACATRLQDAYAGEADSCMESGIMRSSAYMLTQSNGTMVYLTRDSRGESERYEAFSMHAYDASSRLVWTEGLRKDRSQMDDDYRTAAERALAALKGV